MKKICGSIIIVALLSVLLTGCGSKSQDEIRIGAVVPITGQDAIGGVYIKNGIDLAISEFAKDGLMVGDKKYAVKVIFEDNEDKPEITANAYRKLIDQDEVVAIVGPNASRCAIAGGPIAQAAGIPVVTTFATNPKVTEVGDYIFRACFIDSFQGEAMAKFAYESLGAKKAAVLYNNGNDFSKGLTDYFTRAFKEIGGAIVATEAYGGSDIKDFNAQLTNIKASDAEVLYLPNTFYESGLQMNQAKKAGVDIPMIGADGWDNPDVPKIAAGAEEGAMFTCAFSIEDQRPEVQEFVKKYQEMYNELPNSNAILAYEATAIVLQGFQKAGVVDSKALRDTIASEEFELPSGRVKFDSKNNPRKAAVVMKFQDGQQTYVTTIEPK